MSIFLPVNSYDFKKIATQYGLTEQIIKIISYGSFVLILIFFGVMSLPNTDFIVWENGPVELLTFLVFFSAGLKGLLLARQLKKQRSERLVFWFYVAFSVALLVVAMEEIAWGQWFIKFSTPEAWKAINAQGELTLHNHEALQNHLELFPLSAGLLGLLGIRLSFFSFFQKITPPTFLFSWFLVITLVSAIDFFHDYYIFHEGFDILINKLDEAIEMMIGLVSLLIIWLNYRRLITVNHQQGLS